MLNSNGNSKNYLATGCINELKAFESETGVIFNELKALCLQQKDWLFGYFGYDLKNQTEDLSSNNYDGLEFADIHFFQPRYVLEQSQGNTALYFHPEYNSRQDALQFINELRKNKQGSSTTKSLNIKSRITKEDYLNSVGALKQHIQKGDIYEANFCQEFYAEKVEIDPWSTYKKLNAISPTPFSCFYQSNGRYLMCASPERFLKKDGNKIISQPIKGTAKRGDSKTKDEMLKKQLLNDTKERSENVMIVDLVRNDLSKTAKKSSVKVEELFGIYSFAQVHQMISTISSQLKENIHFIDVIKQSFPMGSMTGAPKIKAMELIEQYESTKRGLFSGAFGYITPSGDFDFNVVIRSIQYNASNKYLSFMAGGAITSQSDPEREYDESLLKAKTMFQALGGEPPL